MQAEAQAETSLTQVLLDLIAFEDETECSWKLAEAVEYEALEQRLAHAARRTNPWLI